MHTGAQTNAQMRSRAIWASPHIATNYQEPGSLGDNVSKLNMSILCNSQTNASHGTYPEVTLALDCEALELGDNFFQQLNVGLQLLPFRLRLCKASFRGCLCWCTHKYRKELVRGKKCRKVPLLLNSGRNRSWALLYINDVPFFAQIRKQHFATVPSHWFIFVLT